MVRAIGDEQPIRLGVGQDLAWKVERRIDLVAELGRVEAQGGLVQRFLLLRFLLEYSPLNIFLSYMLKGFSGESQRKFLIAARSARYSVVVQRGS